MMFAVQPQLVVALDNQPATEALALVSELSDAGLTWFKVGLELYTQTGPAFVTELKRRGLHVFLDLKLYDIPNTVAKAVKAAANTGADLLTIHCSGGRTMLTAAQEQAQPTQLSLLGVTVLTSFQPEDFSEVSSAWGARDGRAVVRGAVSLKLAELAAEAGLPGVVSSVSDLRDGEFKKLGWKHKQTLFITPGIRDSAAPKDDQSSVATVAQAVIAGSTHLVIGRPITSPISGSRADAARRFLKDLKEAHVVASHT